MPSITNSGGVVRRPGTDYPAPGNPGAHQAQNKARSLLMDKQQLELLNENLQLLDIFVNQKHMQLLSDAPVQKLDPLRQNMNDIAVYRMDKIMYNESENSYEKLVSVYSALNSFGCSVAMIIQGSGDDVRLYLCTAANGMGAQAGNLLLGNLKGHFPGCEIVKLADREKRELLESYSGPTRNTARTIQSLSVIPARRSVETEHDRAFSAQGLEKFIDAMSGQQYTVIILSQKVSEGCIDDSKKGFEEIYTMLSPFAKEAVSYGQNESDAASYAMSSNLAQSVSDSISKAFGTTHTESITSGRGKSSGHTSTFFGIGFNSGTNWSDGMSSGNSSSGTQTTGQTSTQTTGSAETKTSTQTRGSTMTLNVSRDNKLIMGQLEQIAEQIKRIDANRVFGMWNCSCYVVADDPDTAVMASSTLASLIAGDSMIATEAFRNQWGISTVSDRRDDLLAYLRYLIHPEFVFSQPKMGGIEAQIVTPAIMVSGKELPVLMNLPRKSVPGVVVNRMAEFGRNIPKSWEKSVKRPIRFGSVYHMGQPEKTRVVLDADAFSSHCFISGASGSGKSNTTYHLLEQLHSLGIDFLVIEPAKGEYKRVFGGLKGINIFTTNPRQQRMLKLNPFEFNPRVHVLEHLNRLIGVVSACWPLYGPMPAMLKQAFEEAYIRCGWDLNHSIRIAKGGKVYPSFSDVEATLTDLLDRSEYSAQTKGDYKGALLTRISQLTNGFEGQILCASRGMSDRLLFDASTVIDLSNIGSVETKALIMGMLIIRLREHRSVNAKGQNLPTRHITVLEEAHHILKRCSHEQSADSGNILGNSVAMLTDCISEMRTYGEGFMIIDQSPSAVDIAAIKNTAIKIIMRLPEKDDCAEIGNALSLSEEQVRELSKLDIGVAAVYHAGWTETILAKLGDVWDDRYDKPALEVDRAELLKAKGAAVQLLFSRFYKKAFHETIMDEMDDLLADVGAACPSLSCGKDREISDTVSAFLNANSGIIKGGDYKALRLALSEFLVEFLSMDCLMRVFPLELKAGLMDEVGENEQRKIMAWNSLIEEAMGSYFILPASRKAPKDPVAWPMDHKKGDLFYPLYHLLLWEYGQQAFAQRKDASYLVATKVLKDIGVFD